MSINRPFWGIEILKMSQSSSAPLTQKLPLAKSGSQIDDLWPEKTNIESTAACRALPTYAKVTIHILKKYSLVMC